MGKPATTTQRSMKFYRDLPKVELHRHLEGSLRLNTMSEVARAHGLDIPGTGHLRSLVQVHEGDPYTFQNFLSKFETLRLFYRSPDIIGRITREAIADAAADNVRYMELRFTPVALSVAQGFALEEVMDWVIEHSQQASQEHSVITRLLISFNRHESHRLAEQVFQLAADRLSRGVVGIDIAGNEAQFSALPFASMVKDAHKAGLRITIHAGEWGPASNIADAITTLNAERIGHGVRVMEDPNVVALARERGIPFEVCVTSNPQSGVVGALDGHPLRSMLDAGLNATINTDDPSISQITLGHEYRVACEELGVSLDTLKGCTIAAARAAFLPESDREQLAASVEAEFSRKI